MVLIVTACILILSAVVIAIIPLKEPPKLEFKTEKPIRATKEQRDAFELFKIALNTGDCVWVDEQTYCQKFHNNNYAYVKNGELQVRQLNIKNFIKDWYISNKE